MLTADHQTSSSIVEVEIGDGKGTLCSGSWTRYGAWCWFKVVDLLRKAGHQATAIDLAGCGANLTDPDTITSFEQYNQPLIDFLSSLSASERSKVILVGHSFGGLSITSACEAFPGEFAVLVYVVAGCLGSGLSFEEHFARIFANCQIELFYKNGQDNLPTSFIFKEDSLQDTLNSMSPSEDIVLASMLSRPSPVAAQLANVIELTEKGFKSITKVYIETTKDMVCSLSRQEKIVKEYGFEEALELDSDHSPFFSFPNELLEHLLYIQAKYS